MAHLLRELGQLLEEVGVIVADGRLQQLPAGVPLLHPHIGLMEGTHKIISRRRTMEAEEGPAVKNHGACELGVQSGGRARSYLVLQLLLRQPGSHDDVAAVPSCPFAMRLACSSRKAPSWKLGTSMVLCRHQNHCERLGHSMSRVLGMRPPEALQREY